MSITVRDFVNYMLTLDQDKEVRFIEPLQGDWDEVGYCYVEDGTDHYVLMGSNQIEENFDIMEID